MAPTQKRAAALSALAAPRTALAPVGGNSDDSPLRGGGGAAARKLRKNNLASQSEPDLNAARRRRKRGSKKVKKVKNGALGPREEIHRSNSDPTPTFNPPELSVGGRSMYIGGRPASAKSLTPDQASAVMQELKEVKQQIEAERSVLADQQHRFVSERTKLASRLTETVSICPEPTEKLSSGITGEWSELHSLANQLAVGATQLSMMVETRDATIARLEAANAKQAKALARKTEEHACAMRCLQKFAINNRLLGQMMEATEAELKAVTAATAAAGQKAIDLATRGEVTEEAVGEGEEAAEGDQQSLLETLLSRLEDAELISRKRLEESAAAKAKEEARAEAEVEHPQGLKKKLAEQDADGMWAWKSPVKTTASSPDNGSVGHAEVLQQASETEGGESTSQAADALDEISPVERDNPTIEDIDLQIESEIEREMEAEMSLCMGSVGQGLEESGGDMSLSVLDDFETSMRLGNAERKPEANGVAQDNSNSKQSERDDEFSPVGITEDDLQSEGLKLEDQDWSDPAVSIVDNEDDDVDEDADEDIIRAEAAMAEMASALTDMKTSATVDTGDAPSIAEQNSNGSSDNEQQQKEAVDEEDDDEDENDERETMMKLIKARAARIIQAAHEGRFEPRGGLAAMTEQRVVEALMVANCHAGRAVALLEGADEEWNEVQDMDILEAVRDGAMDGEEELCEDEDEEEEEEEEEDPLVAYFAQPQMPAWMMATMGPAGQRRAMHRPLPPLTDVHDSDKDHFDDEPPGEDVEPHPESEEPKPDGWFALSHPKEDKPGLWAMRADSEVLPMVLSATAETSPTSLRAIVRPEVQQREKTMMNVRETFRNHQWGEEMKRMQKASRRRTELERGNTVASKWTPEERDAAGKSRSPLKNSVSTLDGKRHSFGLAVDRPQQKDGEADG